MQGACDCILQNKGAPMLTMKKVACVAAVLGLGAGTALAADLSANSGGSYKDAPGNYWVVTIGGYGVAVPTYPGSKDVTYSGRPILDVRRAGSKEWLSLPNDAFGVALYETNNFRIGAAADLLNKRSHKDAPAALSGINDIDYTVEVGGFAEYYPAPFLRTRVELLQGVTGAEGFEANLMADFIYKPGARWLLTAGPRLQIVDDKYASAFFTTVAPAPAYTATGGVYTAGVDATIRYCLTDNVSLRAYAEWNRLLGDAADSKIVELGGSADQFQVGVGAAYKFNFAW
jgi:MipA family protein